MNTANSLLRAAGFAGLLALAACGGRGDDAAGENAAQAFDNTGDRAEAMADNATDPMSENTLEDSADALENAGANMEEAIDDADMNTAATNRM